MKKLVYISDVNTSEHIFQSQVQSHVQEYRKYFEVYLFTPDHHPILSNFSYPSFKGDLIFSLINWHPIKNASIMGWLKENKIDVIYSRGVRGGLVGAILYDQLKDTVHINDFRADVLDEYQNKGYIKQFILRRALSKILKNSTKIFFVSTFLRKKYLQKNLEKGDVYPTFAPSQKFNFNPKLRKNIRDLLGYKDDDIVVLYSGNYARWQNVDNIISSFKSAIENRRDIYLLILTKSTELLSEVNNIRIKNINCISVSYTEIQNYYFAADYGLLIRDEIDTNKAAYPTKFTEYINSGLGVILTNIDSDYVRDFTKWNLEGYLLDHKDDLGSLFSALVHCDRNRLKINILEDLVRKQIKSIELCLLRD